MKKIILIKTFVLSSYILIAQNIQFRPDKIIPPEEDTAFAVSVNHHLKECFDHVTGEYSYVSDRRLKTSIQPMPPLIDKIMQLQPVEYEMRYDNPDHKKAFGFIAQDVQKLFPEVVSVTVDSAAGSQGIVGLHAIKYTALSSLAIKAIQEQQQMIIDLRKEVDALKKMLISPPSKTDTCITVIARQSR